MAICSFCKQEMTDITTKGCTGNTTAYYADGTELPAVPYDGEYRCSDCGVRTGQPHHPGCDLERCPRCGGQLVGCDCDKA